MNKFKKSQVLVLFVLILLLIVTPFLPSSLRPTYLYFILNFLIITLFVEAGLLSVISKPLEDRSKNSQEESPAKREVLSTEGSTANSERVEKSSSEKDIRVVNIVEKEEKCSSKPTLLFIGGGEDDIEVMDEEFEVEEEIGGANGQELFAKAETFIRNFYKQLKMQREDSWVYHKSF